jgi:hypothetical protein
LSGSVGLAAYQGPRLANPAAGGGGSL